LNPARGPSNLPWMGIPLLSLSLWRPGPIGQVLLPWTEIDAEDRFLPVISPLQFELMPAYFVALPCAYKSPTTPIHFPLHPSANCASRLMKSLTGTRGDRRHNPSILTSVRYSDRSLWPHPLPLAPAHPLMPSIGSNLQHINASMLGRRPPSPGTFPAPPWRRSRKQSAPPVKLSSMPRPATSCPILTVAQGSPEPHRSSIPVNRPRWRSTPEP
jgi:hypothetical protein